MAVPLATVLWRTNQPVPVEDVHLPGSWHLNSRRVPVQSVPACGEERTIEIQRRRGLLPDDLRGDVQFHPQSEWWDRHAFERDARRRAGLLGEGDYPYGVVRYRPPSAVQRGVPEWPPEWEPQQEAPAEEEEKEEEQPQAMVEDVLPVAEFQPPELSEEEAIQLAIDQSHLEEISRWDDLFSTLRASALETGGASSSRGPPLPPPKTEVMEPPPRWAP